MSTKTLDAYLAEQAQKRMGLGGTLEARQPNEGSKADKKWANAKAISKEDEEDSYMAGKGPKATTRTRERKEKQTVDIDHRFQEQPRGDRGGRGGSRGGRGEFRGDRGGRGESRGDRGGRGESRGDRGGRGDFRGGDRGRGGRGRGESRGSDSGHGGRGGGGRGRGDNVNIADETAFPSLGA